MNSVLFSSSSDEWSTPQDLFDKLDKEFHFTLDPCASVSNHKCSKYFTISENGLDQDWSGEVVFCNPPYGRSIGLWVKKCHDEFLYHRVRCVLLIPARTDTSYFHDYIFPITTDIRFLRGRLHFNNSVHPAPFPSVIVVF